MRRHEVVSAAEFRHWIECYDLTNENAGRVFNVGPLTINAWLQKGLIGAAAAMFKTMECRGISPTAAVEGRVVGWNSKFMRSHWDKARKNGRFGRKKPVEPAPPMPAPEVGEGETQ